MLLHHDYNSVTLLTLTLTLIHPASNCTHWATLRRHPCLSRAATSASSQVNPIVGLVFVDCALFRANIVVSPDPFHFTTYYCCFSNSYFDILLTAAVGWHVAAKVTEIVWRMQIKHRRWRQRDRRIWSLRKLKDKGPFPLVVVERRLRCILTCNVRGARRSFSSLLYQSLCLSAS